MKKQIWVQTVSLLAGLVLLATLAGCGANTATPTETQPSATEDHNASATETTATAETTAQPQPAADPNVLYQDEFKNPQTGWPSETFDNYFIGYHEPEYYHVAITSPNYKTTVFVPNRPAYSDATVEMTGFTFAGKTAETGNFRFGLVLRRAGDQFYAFTISQRTKDWAILKSTSDGITVLQEGNDTGIHEFDTADDLQVDAQGPNFTFRINGKVVAQVSDSDYTTGEVGFYTQTLDAASLHIHYDSLSIRKVESGGATASVSPQSAILYEDLFKNPNTNWPGKTFDNYFIGYHEPEYYHIAITSPNYKTTVFIPEKPIFTDTTIEVSAFTFAGKTAETGDFRFGLVFRRMGDDYYAFAISQRTKSWAVLKSTPSQFVTLKEGTSDAINDFDIADLLRVDIKGSSFLFHINNQFVTQVDDADYPSGEVGFFVQTLDAPNLHIHYDALTVREFEPRLVCTSTALRLNIRLGPGTNFETNDFLVQDTVIEPIGRDSNSEWLNIRTADSSKQGWIANIPEYVSCNASLDVLPVSNP